ncbi:MAG: chemotaxis protein CheR [Deltaproteobacteria bacterium]|nr:chemotaxis protein CheR [Deltaproteobacteria bacterium]
MQEGIPEEQLLSPALFAHFQKLIYKSCGISLADSKRTMLSVRLSKRLSALQLQTFEEYLEYVGNVSHIDNEFLEFLNVVTTNKTDFYRERHHFEFLTNDIIPELLARKQISKDKPLRIWSAGCSSGEEPYTIAMEVAEILGLDSGAFEVLATDISTRVLNQAIGGVYAEESIAPIPEKLRHKYLMRGKGKYSGRYKVVPEIQTHVRFSRLNFTAANYNITEQMHVIFCRNVLIYFDVKTKAYILNKICDQLVSHGHLFIGHSETLVPQEYRLERVLPTVYQNIR